MKHLPHLPLYTDYYQLSMARGYRQNSKEDQNAVFNYFFRDLPFDGGYVIFAGLHNFLHLIRHYHFDEKSLNYLSQQGFDDDFLEYLSNMELSVNVESVQEGQIVFPGEPLVTVSGPLLQCQLLETVLLNQMNYQSLIATKAARIKYASGSRKVMDFGLRRAQGLGGIQASRAGFIGGLEATSNVWAAKEYDIPPGGTIAHSWIQSFESELEAFRQYAFRNPDSTTLLVDTYDTLGSGIPNAIKVGKELEEKGHRLVAIRLDSGDPVQLTKKARKMLDEAGLEYVKIALSDQLDEYVIADLLDSGAPIDLFGVGTRLVTGHESPALDGVYKMCEIDGRPTSKRSDDPAKETLPGRKKILRLYDSAGEYSGDIICLNDEADKLIDGAIAPADIAENLPDFTDFQLVTHNVCSNGDCGTDWDQAITMLRQTAQNELKRLPGRFKRLKKPERYPVWVSKGIQDQISQMKI